MEGPHDSSSLQGRNLPTALQTHILSFLPPNDRALTGRLVSREARYALRETRHYSASLSLPLPPHAAPWAVAAGQEHVRRLPFQHKVQLLCTAASSGSEVNLEVALALLRPSVFPELLQKGRLWQTFCPSFEPGVAAMRASHPQLLGWLLRHCPGLLAQDLLLQAAALHCHLAGLEAVWGRVQGHAGWGYHPLLSQTTLDAAAESPTPDAVAKVQWLLAAPGAACRLEASTAEAAARSGDLARLRWLHEHGCYMGWRNVFLAALEHANLAMAQWLGGTAGRQLPEPGDSATIWLPYVESSARSSDGVAKLQWLWSAGAPQLGGRCLVKAVRAAASKGRVEVMQHLLALHELGPEQSRELLEGVVLTAVGSGSVPCMEFLQQAGVTFRGRRGLYNRVSGSVATVRWLVQQGALPCALGQLETIISNWPRRGPADSRELLEAVQLLVGEAGYRIWDQGAATYAAAMRGDLDLVQYLAQQTPVVNAVPGRGALDAAARSGCEALLEWLTAQPGWLAPWDAVTCPYVEAAKGSDLGTLTALRRLRVLWGAQDVVVRAVASGCEVPALRWLVEQRAPVGAREQVEKALEGLQGRCYDAEAAAWIRSL